MKLVKVPLLIIAILITIIACSVFCFGNTVIECFGIENLGSLSKRLESYVYWMSFLVFILIILGFFHSFFPMNKPKGQIRKHHLGYSTISTFMITVVGLIYTTYSDAFYQHGNPISPILYGINNNVTAVSLREIELAKSPNKCNNFVEDIILILDVSGSINKCKPAQNNWIDKITKNLDSQVKSSSEITPKIEELTNTNTKEGLKLVKLKACDIANYLFSKLGGHCNTKLHLLSLGTYTDFDCTVNIKKGKGLDTIINGILDLKDDRFQADQTRIDRLIAKLIAQKLINGDLDKFKYQKTVVIILSDFFHDEGEQSTLVTNYNSKLDSLVTVMANMSVFMNFFKISSSQKQGTVDALESMYRSFNTKLISEKTIDDDPEIQFGYVRSKKNITFIIDQPFHDSTKTVIKLDEERKDSCSSIRLVSDDSLNHYGQQLKYLDTILQPFQPRTVPNYQKNVILSFEGHAPEQFSNQNIEFYIDNPGQIVSSEIVFKKGLPPFIAKFVMIVVLILLTISLFYVGFLFSLIKIDWRFLKRKKNPELNTQESNTPLSSQPTIPTNSTGGPIIEEDGPTKLIKIELNRVGIKAKIGQRNIISQSSAQDFYRNGHINDDNILNHTVADGDTIPVNTEIRFDTLKVTGVSLIARKVTFTVMETVEHKVHVSKNTLEWLGYSPYIASN